MYLFTYFNFIQEKLQREFEDMKYSGEAKLSRYVSFLNIWYTLTLRKSWVFSQNFSQTESWFMSILT